VNDVSFELSARGVYGLLGANGAGKSTIMNIMCGVLNQTKGDVFIKGIDMLAQPVAAKKLIGFLPQTPPLQSELTVEEFLTHCARIRLMPKNTIKAAVDEVMQKCNVAHFSRRLIGNLSGGYQQRVGIAQAIIHRPEFVVMDEPTNGLDPNQIIEIRTLIREIAEDRTVVLSTHILQEVQAICDHIWMINEGKFVFSGTLHEFDNYILPSSLMVTMMNPPSLAELQQLEGVQQAEAIDRNKFRIRYTDAQEVTDLLVLHSGRNNWRISELSLEKYSLDNIFSELSRKK
jgi:ABC-2 type transport system ATP-binding protein